MKLKLFILSLICLLGPLVHAGNGNFLATLLDGQGTTITNTKVILIFSGAPQSQNNGTVVQWRTAAYTDGNGQILFTNAAPGKWTIATVSGNTVAFSFNMPVTNGTIAVQYNTTADAGATVPGGSVAYDVNASDLRYDSAGAAAATLTLASNNVATGVWVPPGGSSLTNGQTGNVQFTNSTVTVSNLLSLGAITGASVAPSAQSSGQLNINMGSGTLIGSTVNVGGISGNGYGITGINAANVSGTFTGNGGGLTNLQASSLTGFIATNYLLQYVSASNNLSMLTAPAVTPTWTNNSILVQPNTNAVAAQSWKLVLAIPSNQVANYAISATVYGLFTNSWFALQVTGSTNTFQGYAEYITRTNVSSLTGTPINLTFGPSTNGNNALNFYFGTNGSFYGAQLTNYQAGYQFIISNLVVSVSTSYNIFSNSVVFPLPALALSLAPTNYAVENTEFNIYWQDVLRTPAPFPVQAGYWPNSACAVGTNYAAEFRLLSAVGSASNYSLSISAWYETNQLAIYNGILRVASNSAGSGKSRNLLVIGDSTTANYNWVSNVVAMCSSNGFTVVGVGTQGSLTNKYEAHGGWAYISYFNGSDGRNSPFTNGSGVFDFNFYLTNNAITMVSNDWVIFDLGINDILSLKSDAAVVSTATNDLFMFNLMRSNIQVNVPGIRVGMALVTAPVASQDGWGSVYGSVSSGQSFYRYNRNRFFWNEYVIANPPSNAFLVPINACIDTFSNQFTSSQALNARNPAVVTTLNNNVHPATPGYLQIADQIFAFLKGNE